MDLLLMLVFIHLRLLFPNSDLIRIVNLCWIVRLRDVLPLIRIRVQSLLLRISCRLLIKFQIIFQSVEESMYEDVLPENFPVIKTFIGGTRIIGRLCAGNKNGLLLPHTTTDQELWHLRNSLPDRVEVHRIEERLSALGNCIACNDSVSLVHADLDKNIYEGARAKEEVTL